MSRSKTAQNVGKVSIIPGLNLNNKMNLDLIKTVGTYKGGQDIGETKNKHLEDDVVSGVLETKKYRITSQQTF